MSALSLARRGLAPGAGWRRVVPRVAWPRQLAVARSFCAAAGTGEEEPRPRVLWKAPGISPTFAESEHALTVSTGATAGGLGLALLGIAPFTPPNPFMAALVIAVLQVRLGHEWVWRQMKANLRRHVTLLTLEEGATDDSASTLVLTIEYSGGLSRKLHLSPATDDEGKPTFKDVVQKGHAFLAFDQAIGSSDLQEELDAVLSSGHVIASESFSVEPIEEESQEEADRDIQRLSTLTKAELEKAGGKEGILSPAKSLDAVARSSRILASVMLTGGTFICLSASTVGNPAAPPPEPARR